MTRLMLISDPAAAIYGPEIEARVTTDWRIECTPEGADATAWLADRLPAAEALLAMRLPPELRMRARGLRALFFPGAGYVHRSGDELPEGCVLSNVYEHDAPIAEYVMMAILMHVVQVRRWAEGFGAGRWDGNGRTGGERHDEALGRHVVLIGYGTIGRAVEERARAFGMTVEAVRSDHDPADLRAALHRADMLVICCPLTERTEGMIGADELAELRDGALLVNIARGEIVDEAALFDRLRGGRISAALDAWYDYPTRTDEVMHGSRLPFHTLPNVLATPHLSAWTHGLVARRMGRIAENLDKLARGEELDRVVLRGSWR